MTDAQTFAQPPRFVDVKSKRADNDWYQDQPEAIKALLRAEQFSELSWDPACGVGTIPHAMMAAGISCIGSDLVDRKPVEVVGFRTMDFLAEDVAVRRIDNIVSNPPFNLARQFADSSPALATQGGGWVWRPSRLRNRALISGSCSFPLA